MKHAGALTCIAVVIVTSAGACIDPHAATEVRLLATPPRLSLGADAYRDWERWPVLRIGTRTVMRSTFDRAGGNHAVDASHFIREDEGSFVTLDVAGSGVVAFVRTNHWHGSPWRYTVDGRRTIVSETSTRDPDHPVENSTFEPADLFPAPVAVTWSTTKGADLSWVPIPFEKSFELAYGRTHYGTSYYILQLVPEGSIDLVSPLRGWTEQPPAPEIAALLSRAGTDIAPPEDAPGVQTRRGSLSIGTSSELARITGPGTIRALHFSVPRSAAIEFARARLRITWDDAAWPSIDAPVGLFFGTGSLHNRDEKEVLVGALPVNVRFPKFTDTIELATYFPMPFSSSAHVELASDTPIDDVKWEARWTDAPPEGPYGTFHATYVDHVSPVKGRDLVLLDTRTIEGAGEWCGHLVGTSVVFSDRAVLATLEGDPRFFFDDNDTPQAQGTGSEEWGGGGDYWGGRTMTLPLAGHPVGAPSPESAQNDEDKVESLYRFLLADAMPFGKRARVNIEHGGLNESTEHYRSVAYWYGAPEACLVESDAIDIGNIADEARHDYIAIDATEPIDLESRYELGVESPLVKESGRWVRTSSEMTVSIPKDNAGLLLRRTLDYGVVDQRAEVFVAPIDASGAAGQFERAGTWFTAGSNRTLYSNPPDELGAPNVEVQTSDRRLRDDELLIDRRFTEGHARLRLRFVVTSSTPWTELRYRVHAWKVPRHDR